MYFCDKNPSDPVSVRSVRFPIENRTGSGQTDYPKPDKPDANRTTKRTQNGQRGETK